MNTLAKTNERIDEILGDYISGNLSKDGQANALRDLSRDLARRIDKMMLRVADTPVPKSDFDRTMFAELLTGLRDIARGEA